MINKNIRKEMEKYDSLQKIVEQLEKCEYESEAGPLKNNIAFLKLKELSSSCPSSCYMTRSEEEK